jgi:hypothetical protein
MYADIPEKRRNRYPLTIQRAGDCIFMWTFANHWKFAGPTDTMEEEYKPQTRRTVDDFG